MPDEMDTMLAVQRARIAAEERERLIKRARGIPSAGPVLFIGGGIAVLALCAVFSSSVKPVMIGGLAFTGLINLLIGYHRLANERIGAILALLDEEKHGPKEAWIRRLQQSPRS